MVYRAILLFAIISVCMALFFRSFPIGERSTQADIKGGDEWVINITRPHYLFPREWLRAGGMNPIDFWSHAPDPDFEANRLYSHHLDGGTSEAKVVWVQGFHVNRAYSNPSHREEVMAIRMDGEVFEFPVPDFRFYSLASSASFRFLGQTDSKLYYFYHGATKQLHANITAVLIVALPLKSGQIQIVRSDEKEYWMRTMEEVRQLPPLELAFEEICADRYVESVSFAEELFNKDCPTKL
jgi:hypothetical protein